MSAFLCSADHVSAIVTYGMDHGLVSLTAHAATCRMLVAENLRSLDARYSDNESEKEAAAEMVFEIADLRSVLKVDRKRRLGLMMDAVGLAKTRDRMGKITEWSDRFVAACVVSLCDCFDYQACETDDYETTEAARFVAEVRRVALKKAGGESAIESLRNQNVLPWGL